MENGGDFMQLCRLCLVKDQVNIPIFEDQGDIRQIFLKISSCLPVKIAPNDKLPKKICDGCSYKLDMLYEFWNTSANAEKQLVTWLDQAGLKANTETADKTMSVVAQQCSNKPSETIVKQEAMEDAAENQIFMQEMNYKEKWDEASSSAGPSATVTSDEPPPKRARRAAAVKASLNVTPESEDEDDDFDNEAMTKIENESDEEDDDDDMDDDSAYADVPSTSADDQAGPSGVGKDGVEAPLILVSYGNKFEFKIILNSFGEEFMQCLICFKQFRTKKLLRSHMTTHMISRPFECEICKKTFKTNVERNMHAKRHTQNKLQCEVCNRTLSSKASLDIHLKRHRKEFLYKCNECDVGFFSKREYELHNNRKHLGIEENICDICSRSFYNKQALMDHKKNIHEEGEPEFYCELCDRKFVLKKQYRRHQAEHHSNKESKSFICHICGKSLCSSEYLRTHIRIHKGIKMYTCPSCNTSFTSKNTLTLHIRTHTGEKPFECNICKKRFSQLGARNLHLKKHSNEKPFKCELCEAAFVSNGVLNMHKKNAHRVILASLKLSTV